MPYFSCPANLNRRQQVSALDPTFQRFLSQILQGPFVAAESSETKRDSPTTEARLSDPAQAQRSVMKDYPTFTPNFDVIETSDSYYLEGELPGVVDTSNIEIVASDNTLTIRGRVEKGKLVSAPVASTPPAGIEEAPKESKRRSLNPTVEDTDDEDDFSVIGSATAASENKVKNVSAENEVQKRQEDISNKPQDRKSGGDRVWLSERSFGNFQRFFSFPTRVDLESVTAKLEHGVLTIAVPKVLFSGVRKIQID